jgi:biotin synthase-related radical SAM superfamily protein
MKIVQHLSLSMSQPKYQFLNRNNQANQPLTFLMKRKEKRVSSVNWKYFNEIEKRSPSRITLQWQDLMLQLLVQTQQAEESTLG